MNKNDGKKGRINEMIIKYFDALTATNFETKLDEWKKKCLCLSNQLVIT